PGMRIRPSFEITTPGSTNSALPNSYCQVNCTATSEGVRRSYICFANAGVMLVADAFVEVIVPAGSLGIVCAVAKRVISAIEAAAAILQNLESMKSPVVEKN